MTDKHVFFDISVAGDDAKRVIFKLFDEEAPKAALNFRSLCAGLKAGDGSILTYKDSAFHRVIPGFMIQGGDITKGDGTGGVSIYGGKFDDEASALALKHDRPFLLSMANAGKDTNGSQFFVTTVPCGHLDGKHMVFGEVVSGKSVIQAIEGVETGARDAPVPTQRCVIKVCGECDAPAAVQRSPPRGASRSRSRSYSSRSRSTSHSRSRSCSSYSRSSRSRTPPPQRPANGGIPLPSDADPELAAIALMEKRKHKWLARGSSGRERRGGGRRDRSRSPVARHRGNAGGTKHSGVKGRGSVRYRSSESDRGSGGRLAQREPRYNSDRRGASRYEPRRSGSDTRRSDNRGWGGESDAAVTTRPEGRVQHLTSGMRVERRPQAAAAQAAAGAPNSEGQRSSRWGASGYGKVSSSYDDI